MKKEEGAEKTTEKQPISMVKVIASIGVIIALLCCYAFYQESKCKGLKCDEMAMKNSSYCEKHTCTTEGCYNYKDGWSNVCETHHQENIKKIEEDNTIEEMEKELIEKYGEDIFSDEMHMPQCKYSGCNEEGTATYGGQWYCSKHLYEMQEYGNTISK